MRVKNKKEKNEFREAINKHLKNSGESVVANKPLVDSIVEMRNNFRFKVLETCDGGEIVTGVIHSTNEEGEVCPCVLGVIVNELTSDRGEDGKTISIEYLSESQVLDLIQNLTAAYRNLRSINMRLHDLSVCNPLMGLMMIKPMPRKKVSVEPVEKIWLSTKEFAKYIGMSTGYIHDLRKSGQIHHYMIGNTAFFKKSDIDELIEEHKVC